jgi:hypothetical protein
MKNSLDNIKFRTARPATPGTEAKRPGTKERLVGANGEFNASNKQDLLQTLTTLANLVQSGDVTTSPYAALSSAERKELVTARIAHTANTFYKYLHKEEGGERDWAEIGAALSGELTELADREGFMRRLYHRVDVAQGSIPRIRVRSKSVTAIYAASDTQFYPIQARDKYLLPPEFYIKANLRVEEREIAQATGDILEDKFFEGQEQIMRQEDKVWKNLTDGLVGVSNYLQYLAGGLTPANVSVMQQQVNRWSLNATNMLIANDVLQDITGSVAFGSWFDPVSQYEIVTTGQIGTLLGMSLITDAYREPRLKVLNAGEVYILAAPDTLGAFTDRGPIQSVPVDSYHDGVPARGWSMYELVAMVGHNPRALCKGIRS